jgi:hypothetical protein
MNFKLLLFLFVISIYYCSISVLCVRTKLKTKKIKKVTIHALDENSISNNWEYFKARHRKTYRNETHQNKRKKIFIENLKKINEHNLKFNNGTEHHALKLNHFADWVIYLLINK